MGCDRFSNRAFDWLQTVLSQTVLSMEVRFSSMNVLVIEDESSIARSIELALRRVGMQAHCVATGGEGLEQGLSGSFVAIVLDVRLPDMSGLEVLQLMRRRGLETPVIILSGLAGVDDKVRGFHDGADDYLTKPYDYRELIARLQSLIRRDRRYDHNSQIGDIRVDVARRAVSVGEAQILLTGKEFAVFNLLFSNIGRAVSRERIMEVLYDRQVPQSRRIIDVFICKTRHKLKKLDPRRAWIRAEWGEGYALVCEIEGELPSHGDAPAVAPLP